MAQNKCPTDLSSCRKVQSFHQLLLFRCRIQHIVIYDSSLAAFTWSSSVKELIATPSIFFHVLLALS